MKIIRRFFIYLITVLTVLVSTYCYVYWGDLFGNNTPIGYLLGSSPDNGNISVIKDEAVDEDGEQLDEAETVEKIVVEEMAVPPSVDVVQAEPQLAPQPQSKVTIVSRDDKAAIESQLPVEAVIPIGDLWKQARDSFHYRDYETSIESYKQLIARTQDNFDAYEELGDVYKYYGMNKEAAAAYYGAATILVRLGRIDHAADFMKPLTLTDAVKARSLLDLIKAAR